ncbi:MULTISPECIES: hypothetical protein [Streptococcus]|uniref:Lipoprotein n=1 Tax=Streptococcus macedonicus TaxID=59310 RepID=A0AAP8G0B9_STRMC|nr:MULTISPECIES: hypothetical protein [Streptococcus]PHV58388.1 hypothetical protein CS009_02445 [Streptococcus macedonicus]
MKLKRLLGVLALGLAVVTLAACGQKSTENVIKNELKDSYTGYSNARSYDGKIFKEGSDTLTFDKKANTITNSDDYQIYFSVVSDKDKTSEIKSVLKELDSELSNTDNFTIAISRRVKNPTVDNATAFYQIALSDGGKTIKIYELRRNPRDYGYYEFSGESA